MADTLKTLLEMEHGYGNTEAEMMLEEKKMAILLNLYKLTMHLKDLIPNKMGESELATAKNSIRELMRIIMTVQIPDFKKLLRDKSEAYMQIKGKDPKLAEALGKQRELIMSLIGILDKQAPLLKGIEYSITGNNFREMDRLWDIMRFTMKTEADLIKSFKTDESIIRQHAAVFSRHAQQFSQVNENLAREPVLKAA